ncbi:MAG: hypothetical protein WBJ37_13530 [Bacteroidales bacterium]
MASIRELKKEIDNQIFGIISDCMLFMSRHPDHDENEVNAIVQEAYQLRNNLIYRIYHFDNKEDIRAVKNHFKEIKSDLSNGIDQLCMKLSSLSSKKKKK